jgi:hypothetical protein
MRFLSSLPGIAILGGALAAGGGCSSPSAQVIDSFKRGHKKPFRTIDTAPDYP